VNVFHHHLETVETACFRDLNFGHEALGKVLKDNTIRSSEESENVLDKVLLVICQLLPVLNVCGKVDFFSGPECCLLVLVHLPDVVVLDGEEDKAVGVLLKKRLWNSESLTLRGTLKIRLVRFHRFYFQILFGNIWA
jgi:hypothetical protein